MGESLQKSEAILLVGLGSIGKRHLNNIISLGYTDITVVTTKNVLPENYSPVSTLAEALKLKSYKAAVICAPTAKHDEIILAVLDANISRIFLEKPVSNTLYRINEIIAARKSAEIFVGYDLRFDPGLLKVKDWIEEGKIGRVLAVNSFVGQYLPDWRPEQSYELSYSAKTAEGGGVVLDLIHEFDYLYFLFGEPINIQSQVFNTGSLNIESEDVAQVLLRFADGIHGMLHMDYLQRFFRRDCYITGSTGNINLNFSKGIAELQIIGLKNKVEFDYSDYSRNDRFLEIMSIFLNNPDDPKLCTFDEAVISLTMALKAKSTYHKINNKCSY